MDVSEAVKGRRSIRSFEREALLLSREQIENLIMEACRAPSEYNLQPWHFIVVRDRERKQALYDCCQRQDKIRESSALIIILGDTRGWERADQAAGELLAARDVAAGREGPTDQNEVRALAETIRSTYLRDERLRTAMSFRNPSLVAMNLMLLAVEKGIATCPVAGFSEAQIRRAFEVPDRYVPVMVIALGMPSLDAGRPALKPRRPVSEVVSHEDMSNQGRSPA